MLSADPCRLPDVPEKRSPTKCPAPSRKGRFDEDEGRQQERACTDKREVGLWIRKEREEGSYPEPSFPEDFGERLERLIELAGLSREEFAQCLGIEYDRVDRVVRWRGSSPAGRCGTSLGWRGRSPADWRPYVPGAGGGRE